MRWILPDNNGRGADTPDRMFTTFVSNIAYGISRRCLYDLFIQVTPVRSIHYRTKIAFVDYYTGEDQSKSIEALDLTALCGRRIVLQRVEPHTVLSVSCDDWADRGYLSDVFGHFGACSCRRVSGEFRCVYRRRRDAEAALRAMDGRSILGNTFAVKLLEE